MTEHTPAPWKIYHDDYCFCDDGGHIGSCETKEDAKFVVSLVNSHDDLQATISRLTAERDGLRERLLDAAAHLVGAASAYRKHAARHRSIGRGQVDPFFTTRASDFEKAAERARAALATPTETDADQ